MHFRYFLGPESDMSYLLPETAACALCGNVVRCFRLSSATCPELTDERKEAAIGCYFCLRGGRFQFWHDTEIGLLDEHGLTHFYNHHQPPPADFPTSALAELRRTPQIVTWQQEVWLTCCNDFMAYIGTWGPKDFYAHAPAEMGEPYFSR